MRQSADKPCVRPGLRALQVTHVFDVFVTWRETVCLAMEHWDGAGATSSAGQRGIPHRR
ncbi:hypothetical protein IMZ48_06900 [Candidatus Bathyarchaeota archaeon]|nr:hypothetical protein [Candidatus Bathyarchaeota archaeon]